MTAAGHPVAGLVLAAGAGRRWEAGGGQGPKVLARPEQPAGTRAGIGTGSGDGCAAPPGRSLLTRAVDALTEGGCAPVVVVVGHEQGQVTAHLAEVAPHAVVVPCPTWGLGMGESLRTGLRALPTLVDETVEAVVVTLADLPGQVPESVLRLRAAAPGPDALGRAVHAGRPTHPVLVGRSRWAEAARAAHDDVGARTLLADPSTVTVDVSDLTDGRDADAPDELAGCAR